MTVVQSDLFSHIKGSLGGVIIYEVDGQIRMRSKPGSYKKSESSKAQAQKNKFRGASAFYNQLGFPLRYSWDDATQGKPMSGYNLFIKENIHSFTATGEITDYSGLKICYGNLFIPERIEMEYISPELIRLQWNPDCPGKGYPHDLLQIVFYDPARKSRARLFLLPETQILRSAGKAEFTLPAQTGKEIHLFCYFKGKYRDIFSNSRFIGTVDRSN